MTTLASMSEIVRVGGWALRGAGFPFGVAERAARMLAWTEAARGGAVRDIRANEAAIARSRTAGPVHRARDEDGAWIVEGGGRHVLELGPPLVDLATSGARRDGLAYVRIDNVVGALFVTALADLVAQRGLAALIVFRAGNSVGAHAKSDEAGWAVASGPDAGSRVMAGPMTSRPLRDMAGLLNGAEWSRRISVDIDSAAAPGCGFVSVLAAGPDHAVARHIGASTPAFLAASESGDLRERVAEAYREGVPMRFAELQDLYDLEIRTWAPTSERSRSQAGYGKF